MTFLIALFSYISLTLSLDVSWNNSNPNFFSENWEEFPISEPEIMILLNSLFKLALITEEKQVEKKTKKIPRIFKKCITAINKVDFCKEREKD